MSKTEQPSLEILQRTVLLDVSYQVASNTIVLLFESAEEERYSLQASSVLQLSISSTDDRIERVDVFNVSVREIHDAGKKDLDRLGYLWHDLDRKAMTHPSTQLFYLLVEGDVCIAIVCGRFELVTTTHMVGMS
jgi:hypothetical protein